MHAQIPVHFSFHFISTFTPSLTFSSLTSTHQATPISFVPLSISICKNTHQANALIHAFNHARLGQQRSPSMCHKPRDRAPCSLSPGVNYLVRWKEGLDLITGTK